MDKDLHHIEDLFKSGLDEHEEMPSAKVWDAVDNRLDKDTVAIIKKKNKIWKRLSLLLLLLLIGLSIYELNSRRIDNNFGGKNGGESNKEIVSAKNEKTEPDNSRGLSKEQTDTKNINVTAPPDNNPIAVDPENGFGIVEQNQKGIASGETIFVADSDSRRIIPASIKKNNVQPAMSNESITNNSILTTEINSSPVNELSILLRPLSFISPEKITRADFATTDSKKSWQSLASTKKKPLFIAGVAMPAKKDERNRLNPFSITAFFSPDKASYRLENDDTNNQPANAAQIKQTEKHEFSSTSGVLVDYRLNNSWSLQSGLTFANTNISIEPQTLYAEADNTGSIKYRVNLSSGYGYILPTFQSNPVVGDSVYASAAEHKLRYVGIPVAAKYNLTKGKLSIEIMAGAGINFLTRGKFETEIQRGASNEIDVIDNIKGLKSIYINGLAGIGADYKITNKISLTVMPTARFAVTPINKGAAIKTYPNSFGVAGGLKIRL